MRRWLAAVGAVALAAVAPAADPAALTLRLGHPVPAERDSATRALAALGASALPALEDAARSSNPEVVRRAAPLLVRARLAADSAARLRVPPVRLTLHAVPLRDAVGRRLEDVAEMLWEGNQRQGTARREVYRHIGDFTLFWTGVYPEALRQLQPSSARDSLLDYTAQGKRSYRIAGEFDIAPYADEAPVLMRLADEFELCSIGLRKVRSEWERTEQRRSEPAS